MASVNWMKMKSASEAKAVMRHCDADERLKHEHSNKQIDKSKTGQNYVYFRGSYSDMCAKYDDRIKQLDSTTNRNRRKDRVTLFSLEVPLPDGIKSKADEQRFFKLVGQMMSERYGNDNLINGYVHCDEIHDYVDSRTGDARTSRVHAHFFFVPEVDGQLNGKAFSSKARMTELNTAIDRMCSAEFGCHFMTGEKTKGTTVEHLKAMSASALVQREAELMTKEAGLNAREAALKAQEDALKQKAEEIAERDAESLKAADAVRTSARRLAERSRQPVRAFTLAETQAIDVIRKRTVSVDAGLDY